MEQTGNKSQAVENRVRVCWAWGGEGVTQASVEQCPRSMHSVSQREEETSEICCIQIPLLPPLGTTAPD